MPVKEKVLVAMSGGVDSSVAAILLREQGYEVLGVTMKVWDYESSGTVNRETGCCSLDAINDARLVAVKFGFPHYVMDLRKDFGKKIIGNFIEEYLAGRTPNPCVLCNRYMKWEDLLRMADQTGCRYIATGHYARVVSFESRWFLQRGNDPLKDQTYVLWGLTQEQLSRTLFPLGNLNKEAVKDIARSAGIPRLAAKSESFDICFIPDNDYRGFLKRQVPGLGEKVEGGNFVDGNGKILGRHHGYPFYTIGQRKGLEVAVGYPLYVNRIDAATNTVVLGPREALLKQHLRAGSINLMKYPRIETLENVTTRIRYHDPGTLSALNAEGEDIAVRFSEPVSAITPGQSAVFYQDNDLIGGGIIL